MLKNKILELPYSKRNILYTVLLATGMMVGMYIMLGIFPFGDGTILTGDLNVQYINYFAHYKRAFAGQAGFTYGFDKSLGGSLLGLFAYYVSSPLNLLYLLVPTEWSPIVSSFLLLVKIVFACGFFSFYSNKKYGDLGSLGIALSLSYGFIAYSFAYAQNIMWHDVVMVLPLLCYGIDRLLTGKGNLIYTLVLAYAIFANFYIAYMACIFAVIYFVYCMLLEQAGIAKWKTASGSFIGGSLLGGGLPMFLLLPALANVGSSKGELFSYQFSAQTNFSLFRLPERLFWGSFVWEDVIDGKPQIYCGLLVLLLVGSYFISKKIPIREKIISGSVVGFLILSFWIKGLDVLWHGFKPAVWFPYRNSYIFCFFLVLLATQAVAKKAIDKKTMAISAFVFTILGMLYVFFPGTVGRKKMLVGIILLIVYSAAIILKKDFAIHKNIVHRIVPLGIVLLVGAELSANAFLITNRFEKYPLSVFQEFIQNNTQTLASIKESTPENFRVEKNFQRSFNDAMLVGGKGISHFGSTQDDNSVDTLASLGYRNYGLSNGYFYGSTAFADSILGIGYVYSDEQRTVSKHFETTSIRAPFTVYRNPYVLPPMFAINGEAQPPKPWEAAENPFAYQNAFYAQLTGNQKQLFTALEIKNATTGNQAVNTSYTFVAEEEGYYYLFAKAANGWFYSLPVTVNNIPTEEYLTAEQYGILNLGYFAKGEEVQVKFNNQEEINLEILHFAYCTQENLESLQEYANANRPKEYTIQDGKVTAIINAQEDQKWMFAAIPYEEGWQVKVNGEKVQLDTIGNGLLAVPLTNGENSIEMNYIPARVGAGLQVSVASLLVLLGYQFYKRRKDKIMVK